MPQLRQMMGERLRTAVQGADTVVWLALSGAAAATPSGSFYQGGQYISREYDLFAAPSARIVTGHLRHCQ